MPFASFCPYRYATARRTCTTLLLCYHVRPCADDCLPGCLLLSCTHSHTCTHVLISSRAVNTPAACLHFCCSPCLPLCTNQSINQYIYTTASRPFSTRYRAMRLMGGDAFPAAAAERGRATRRPSAQPASRCPRAAAATGAGGVEDTAATR